MGEWHGLLDFQQRNFRGPKPPPPGMHFSRRPSAARRSSGACSAVQYRRIGAAASNWHRLGVRSGCWGRAKRLFERSVPGVQRDRPPSRASGLSDKRAQANHKESVQTARSGSVICGLLPSALRPGATRSTRLSGCVRIAMAGVSLTDGLGMREMVSLRPAASTYLRPASCALRGLSLEGPRFGIACRLWGGIEPMGNATCRSLRP